MHVHRLSLSRLRPLDASSQAAASQEREIESRFPLPLFRSRRQRLQRLSSTFAARKSKIQRKSLASIVAACVMNRANEGEAVR